MRAAKDPPAPTASADERRTALLEAAIQIFARYGYKKASMDEVARAAGLSRQGLYLHFPSKEALFRNVVEYLHERSLRAAKAALGDETRSVEERLTGAFDAMYGQYLETLGSTPHLAELLATATHLLGPLVLEQERAFRRAIGELLTSAGLVRRWEGAGFAVGELADMLDAIACGYKHRPGSRADFLARVGRAMRIIRGTRSK